MTTNEAVEFLAKLVQQQPEGFIRYDLSWYPEIAAVLGSCGARYFTAIHTDNMYEGGAGRTFFKHPHVLVVLWTQHFEKISEESVCAKRWKLYTFSAHCSCKAADTILA